MDTIIIDASRITRDLAAIVGDDGTGDLRVIVDAAIRDGIYDVQQIADIVREARADATAERVAGQ